MNEQDQEEEDRRQQQQRVESTGVDTREANYNQIRETTLPKVTKMTNLDAQNELIVARLPRNKTESIDEDSNKNQFDDEEDNNQDQGNYQQVEAQEDQTSGKSVLVDPNDDDEDDDQHEDNQVNKVEVNYADKQNSTAAGYNDHQLDESRQLISRRAHSSVGAFGLSKELRKLRDQRKKLFTSKGLSSRRRRRRRKKAVDENEHQKNRTTNSKLIKSMQTRQGSILASTNPSSSPASSHHVNLLGSPHNLAEAMAQTSAGSSISSAIKQHLPSFQLSSAVQKLLLSKLIGQQSQPNPQTHNKHRAAGPSQFNQLAAPPFGSYHDHQASSSPGASMDALPGHVQLAGHHKQPDLDEPTRLAGDLLDQFAQQADDALAGAGPPSPLNFRLPSAAASSMVPTSGQSQGQQLLRFQQPGKQLIPVEIIGIDPSVSSSILYGPTGQELGSTSGGAASTVPAEVTPGGEQVEQPLSDSSQVFGSSGEEPTGQQSNGGQEEEETGQRQQQDFESRPPNSINEQLTRFHQPATRHTQPKPSSVFHIHHFHHTNPKIGAESTEAATPTTQEPSGAGGAGVETSQASGESTDQQAEGQQEASSGQQQPQQQLQGNGSEADQSKQQVAMNEKGELVYVTSEAPSNEPTQQQQQVLLVQPQQQQANEAVDQTPLVEQPPGDLLEAPKPTRTLPSWRHNSSGRSAANEHWQTLPSQVVAAANVVESPQSLIGLQRGQQFANTSSSSLPYNNWNLRHQQAYNNNRRKQRVFYTNLGQTVSLIDGSEQQQTNANHLDNLLGPNGTIGHMDDTSSVMRPGMLMVSYRPAASGQQQPETYLNASSREPFPPNAYNQRQEQLRQQSAYNEGSESKPFQQIIQTNPRLLLNKHLLNAYEQANFNSLRPPTANLTDLNATLNRVRSSTAANQPPQVLFKSQRVPFISMNSSPGDQSYWPRGMNNTGLEDEDRRILAKFNALHQLNGQRARQQQQANLLLDNTDLIKHLQHAGDKHSASRIPFPVQGNSTKVKNDELISLINSLKQRQQLVDVGANSTSEPARFELTAPSDARLAATSKVIRHNNNNLNHLPTHQKKNNLTQIKDLNQISTAVDELATVGANRSQPVVEEPPDQLADSTGFSNIAFAFIFIVSFLTLLLIAASMFFSRRRGSRRCSRLTLTGKGAAPSGGANGGSDNNNKRLGLSQRSKHFVRSLGPGEQMSVKSVGQLHETGERSDSTLARLKASRSGKQVDATTDNNNDHSQLGAKWRLSSNLTPDKQQQVQKPRLATFNAASSVDCGQPDEHGCNNIRCSPGDIKTLNTKLQRASYLKSIISQPSRRQQVSGTHSAGFGKSNNTNNNINSNEDADGDGDGDDDEEEEGGDHDDDDDAQKMTTIRADVCPKRLVGEASLDDVARLNRAKPNKTAPASPSASTSALYNYRRSGLINQTKSTKTTTSTSTATPEAAAATVEPKNQFLARRLRAGDDVVSTIGSLGDNMLLNSRVSIIKKGSNKTTNGTQKTANFYNNSIESRQSNAANKKTALK